MQAPGIVCILGLLVKRLFCCFVLVKKVAKIVISIRLLNTGKTTIVGPKNIRGKIMVNTRGYREHLLESLKDPDEAAAYINAAMEDDDLQVFLLALRDVADAKGGIGDLAKRTELNRESLYRTLSEKGNPRLSGLKSVLEACGLCLSVAPLKTVKTQQQ